jgi:hypothetical protein
MPKIIVAKAFNLLLTPGGDKLRFEPGVHDVSEDVAGHWYVQQHLAAGGPSGVKIARDAADAAFLTAKAAVAEYERLEEAAQRSEAEAGVEVSEPAYRRLGRPPEADGATDQAEAKPRRQYRRKAAAEPETPGAEIVEAMEPEAVPEPEVAAESPPAEPTGEPEPAPEEPAQPEA